MSMPNFCSLICKWFTSHWLLLVSGHWLVVGDDEAKETHMVVVTCLMSELLKPITASLSVQWRGSKQAFVGRHAVAECTARSK
jgi:hypothetical protein